VVTLFSRLIYETYEKDTAIIGAPYIEECRWMKPVFPDDTLSCERECLETKNESDGVGTCRFRWKFFDQDGEQKTDITGWSKIKKREK
jgi:acyl dehydratase